MAVFAHVRWELTLSRAGSPPEEDKNYGHDRKGREQDSSKRILEQNHAADGAMATRRQYGTVPARRSHVGKL